MKITTQKIVTAGAGGISVKVVFEMDDVIGKAVSVECSAVDDDLDLTPEIIEMTAALVRAARKSANDFRSVCPTHGYRPRDEYGDCKACEAEKEEAAAVGREAKAQAQAAKGEGVTP